MSIVYVVHWTDAWDNQHRKTFSYRSEAVHWLAIVQQYGLGGFMSQLPQENQRHAY